MSTISKLNVEIGVITKNLQKGLADAERSMRQSGAKLSRIGNEVTTSLSLPLGLLGFAAIKAAGEFEGLTMAMRSTFQNAGRSIAEADAEVEKLRNSARAPGLDFEQAIKASIRLQAVGLNAETARVTIEELANAIASTGGTAENLESVTVQFSQMISKGKVLAGDLRIVQENLPIVSDLMQKAFGTSNSEAIQKLGISGKDFVTKITAEMGKLARVQGGISNSLVNAGSAIKVFAAGLGDEINKVFDLDKQAGRLEETLQSVIGWFKGLSDGTKVFIVQAALMVVAIGPILKVFGSVLSLGSTIAGAFKTLAGIIGNLLVGNILNAVQAFKALTAAQQANVIGLLIAAVTGLYFAYQAYASELTNAEAAQKSVNDVERAALDNTAEQKVKLEQLLSSYKNEKTTLDEKKAILQQLIQISPEYYGGIRAGIGDVEAITEATRKYTEQLTKNATIEGFNQSITEQQKVINNASESIGKSANPMLYFGAVMQGARSAIHGVGFESGYAATMNEEHAYQVGILTDRANENIKALVAKRDAVISGTAKTQEQIDAEKQAVLSADALALAEEKKSQRIAAAREAEAARSQVLIEVLKDIKKEADFQNLVGEDDLKAKLQVAESGLKKLLDAGWKPSSEAVIKLAGEVKVLKTELEAFGNFKAKPIVIDIITKGAGQKGKLADDMAKGPRKIPQGVIDQIELERQLKIQAERETQDKIAALQMQALQSSFNLFSNFSDQRKEKELRELDEKGRAQLAAAEGNSKLQAKIQADLDKKRAVIEKKAGVRKKALALAEAAINIAVAISHALKLVPFSAPFVAATAAAGALQLGVIASQKFAAGTRDAPGGLALVGERGPEIVNIPKHSQVFSAGQTATALRGAGSNVHVSGVFSVRGTDLVLVLENTNNQLARAR